MIADPTSLARSRTTDRPVRAVVSWATRAMRTEDRYRALPAVAL
jgi:hypothetical protein